MAAVLYDFPLAFNPAKARLALVECGVPFTSKIIDLVSEAGSLGHAACCHAARFSQDRKIISY